MPADEVSGFSATTLNQTNATRSLFSWGNIVRFREYSSWSARGKKGGGGDESCGRMAKASAEAHRRTYIVR